MSGTLILKNHINILEAGPGTGKSTITLGYILALDGFQVVLELMSFVGNSRQERCPKG